MSKLPYDPFNRTRLPADFDRAGRVALIGQVALDLIATGQEAEMFVGTALLAWLETGGDLARDHFGVVRPKSHVTPVVLWRQLQAAHFDESARQRTDGDFPAPSPENPE